MTRHTSNMPQAADGSGALHRSEAMTWGRRLLVSVLLTAPVAAFYMTLMFMPKLDRWVSTASPWRYTGPPALPNAPAESAFPAVG